MPALQQEEVSLRTVADRDEVRGEPHARRRRLLLGLGLATVAAGSVAWFLQSRRTGEPDARLRSLAVLPFGPLIEGVGDPALEFGMTDTLITRLSALPGLVVRPLSSVRTYAAAQQDPLQAGRELRAEAVLEGHVLIRGNRVRVTARLLEVATGAALWSDSFEEPLDQFFAAQDALAGQVVTALQIEMTDRDRLKLLDRPTSNVRAWQLYSNGRYYFERKTPEGFRRALEYYEAAEKLDPTFSLAAVGQADAWAVLGVFAPSRPPTHLRAPVPLQNEPWASRPICPRRLQRWVTSSCRDGVTGGPANACTVGPLLRSHASPSAACGSQTIVPTRGACARR